MPISQVEADYSRYQSALLSNLQAGVVTDFPTPSNALKKPEKIVVQAHPDNSGYVIVGQGTTLPESGAQGGYFIPPGGMQILSGRDTSVWKAAGSGVGGQALIVTYVSGAS